MIRDVHRRGNRERESGITVGLKIEENLRRELRGNTGCQYCVRDIDLGRVVGVELRCDARDAASYLGVGGRRYHAPPFVCDGTAGENNEVPECRLIAHLANKKEYSGEFVSYFIRV